MYCWNVKSQLLFFNCWISDLNSLIIISKIPVFMPISPHLTLYEKHVPIRGKLSFFLTNIWSLASVPHNFYYTLFFYYYHLLIYLFLLTMMTSNGISFSGNSSLGSISSFGAIDLISSMFLDGKKAKNPVGNTFSEGTTWAVFFLAMSTRPFSCKCWVMAKKSCWFRSSSSQSIFQQRVAAIKFMKKKILWCILTFIHAFLFKIDIYKTIKML